ncbi:uncharacterized protein LOC108113898 [Drosophila eugracilis]|uniref:uncharacterized protein LOC108113898 n=1 Tax=Drosophila eugracilis TaxID=29029 RepID=UPI001BD95354|nr:uncharacterized protein LOC108113898 [Drosophila eugracilis]
MKYPLLLIGSLSLAHGLALYYPYVYTAEGSAVFTPTQQQYIAQDQLGQYSYGYAEPLSSKQETRTIDGVTQGTYSYRDALGKKQTVNYVADANGFHVAATNLPKAVVPQESLGFSPRSASHPVEHSVEHPAVVSHPVVPHPVGHHPVEAPHHPTVVETGRSAHPEGHHPVEHHEHSVVDSSVSGHSQLPHPVSDTVEVAAVKSLHLKRVEDEAVRNQVLAKVSVPLARSHHVVVPAPVYGYTMQFLNLCLIFITIAMAAGSPTLEYGAPPSSDTISQYHTQDEHGQYAYGYMAPLYSKHETRTLDGVVRGTFSHVDANGETQTVDYVADAEGFHVTSALPNQQPNQETPEVAALRAQHLEAHNQAKLRLAGDTSVGPQPVQDTPEVASAKVAFFKRFEAEKLRNQLLAEKKVLVIAPPSPIAVRSQPLYVYQPTTGFVYNFHSKSTPQVPSRNYLPVA